ncbi:MAG: hypothetical protein PVS3B3_17470 [Ktedonobacteraceae bacterium]
MANLEKPVPNEYLLRARSLCGWSQAELAARIGTSFEMVSRWERGITVPSSYYRERLCATLGKTAEELGLAGKEKNVVIAPATPYVFFASSYKDAEKPFMSHLKTTLQAHGITLWSPRRLSKQETATLHESVRVAQAVVIIISSETRSSRHVRTILELARTYHRPVCGVWIEGESWQEYLPETSIELVVTFDARKANNPTVVEEIAATLKEMGETRTTAPLIVSPSEPQIVAEPALPVPSTVPSHKKSFLSVKASLLIGMAIFVLVGGVFGSFSFHSYFLALGAHPNSSAIAHGGTWVNALNNDPDSLIPNGLVGNATEQGDAAGEIEQALYLPLFYSDAQGIIHAGAATEVPTLQNGDVNATATIWTFRLRPHLVWSDGQPYDAHDVDYTWRLWLNPTFSASNTTGLNLITRADVSPDHLSITFHLKQPFAPFLAEAWVDGANAPLPAHHFRSIAPVSILKSSDNLNPKVTSGPFMMSESLPGNHYTVIRNPRYYRASEGQPYLDKVTFLSNPLSDESVLSAVQKGLFDSTTYTLIPNSASRGDAQVPIFTPPSNAFEALYFNFHNPILATHWEVRQAIAMAVDQPTLINTVLKGFAHPLCTDHTSIYHPGYEPSPPCPLFDLATANKLLDDNGWRKGSDGVRMKEGQRLEFEYSTALSVQTWRLGVESMLRSDFQKVGIKLDIQNYPPAVFFGSFLPNAASSPPSGAIAGRYDIAEFANNLSYDPDDSSLFACNQTPPNVGFYCNHRLDALYMQEQATADPGIRQRIFIQIHRMYLTQFPFVVLANPFLTVLSKKGMHNFQPGPFYANTNMWEWWCDQGKC